MCIHMGSKLCHQWTPLCGTDVLKINDAVLHTSEDFCFAEHIVLSIAPS